MTKIKLPPNVRPNYSKINRMVAEILQELGNPQPPIQLDELASRRKWRIEFEELFGPDGYTTRVRTKSGRTRFCIFVATDFEGAYTEMVIRQRQRFTIAHEIGHIVLHGNYDWNSTNEGFVSLMEFEAYQFASKLLMPDYVFESVADLNPEALAEKCGVNYSAAFRRITGLNGDLRNRLIREEYREYVPKL